MIIISINAGSVYSELLFNTSKYEKSMRNAEKQANGFAKNMDKIGTAISAAFTINAIKDFTMKTIEVAASLKAMDSQFSQVFKGEENQKAVEGISQQVVDLGIHADRLTSSWNKFGGQVKGAGMDSEMALQAVDRATRLAADGAAFFDTSLENSTASLASFMKGNFEAGDSIGVFTSAKQMDVKANEMYGKSWADLTESERQWLLLDTVEKTYEMNGAMGQASRESESYENVMGNLRATFERLYAVIGEPILDKFLIIVGYVTDKVEVLQESIENGTSIFNKFGDAVQFVKDNSDAIIPVLAGVTAAMTAQSIINTIHKGYIAFKLATQGTTIAQIALNAVMSANPFGLVAIAIGLLVTAGIALYRNWDTLKAKAIELGDVISEIFTKLVDDAKEWGTNLVDGLWNGISSKYEWIVGKIKRFASGIADTFTNFFDMRSPSVLTEGWGININEGLAIGIEKNAHKPISKMTTLSKSMGESLQQTNEIEKIYGRVPKYASGTDYHKGGLAWVGEEGPELVELPRGSKVFNNNESMEMMSSEVKHSGTIRVEGVNSENQVMAVVDIVMDELRREVRS